MFMRPDNSEAPGPASEDLVERLKVAANDAALLREIVESNSSASVAAAIAALLAGCGCSATTGSILRKKNRNRPCPSTPNETLIEILLFADRDALDAMQLVCRFMLEFIHDREAKELPLRSISRLTIGEYFNDGNWEDHYWIPSVKVVRDSNAGMELCPDTVHQLVPYLRLAYCHFVCIEYRRIIGERATEKHRGVAYSSIFGDLALQSTFTNALMVHVNHDGTVGVLRALEAFKPLSGMVVKMDYPLSVRSFDEEFFISAAERGARSIKFDSVYSVPEVGLLPALSFGFAEPTTGGDRSISSVECKLDNYGWDGIFRPGDNFLAELIKKASELNGGQRIDFTFSISELSRAIDPAGFEKYHKDKGTWVVNDLENGIKLEVVEADKSIQIHVFSSVNTTISDQ